MTTFRTYELLGLSILSLAFIAPAAQAKKENPPTNESKASLKMSSPVVDLSPAMVTISWSTNKPADTSISLSTTTTDPSIVLDQTPTKHHEISMQFLSPGLTYHYIAVSTNGTDEPVYATGTFVAL